MRQILPFFSPSHSAMTSVDLVGDVSRLVVVALHEGFGELGLGDIEALVEDELDRTDGPAFAHDEDAGSRDGLLAVEADEIDVHIGGEHDLLAHIEGGERLDPVLEAPCPLEVELVCRLMHLVGELVHDVRALALQEPLHLAHVLGVVDRIDGADADAGSLPHVVVEAGPSLLREEEVRDLEVVWMGLEDALCPLPLDAVRRADRHDLAQGIHGLAGCMRIGIGPEIAGPLPVPLAGVLDGREGIGFGDCDIGVGLVVLEVDVVVGVVLGDEVALEHEGLVFVVDDDVVERAHLLHHQGDLLAVIGQVRVLPHAVAEVLRLPDIDDGPLGIFPEVASRFGRDLLHLLSDGGLPVVADLPRQELVPHGYFPAPSEASLAASAFSLASSACFFSSCTAFWARAASRSARRFFSASSSAWRRRETTTSRALMRSI